VVEKANIDQFEGRFQPSRDALVGLTGFRYTRRVVVSEDNGGGVDGEGLFYDFARVYRGPVDRAAKQFVETQDTVPVVEKQAAKHLVPEVAHTGFQKGLGIGRAADRLADRQRLRIVAAGQFGQRAQRGETPRANTMALGKIAGFGVQQLPKTAKSP
jgi:hypothetical protein